MIEPSSVALIMARGGSKRIRNKNTRLFCSQPMLSWPIAAARAANVFERILVSTEDAHIAAIARQYGAEQAFERPRALADDHATTFAVIRHAVHALAAARQLVPHMCCLYGTSAFVTPQLLQKARAMLLQTDAEWVFAVNEFAHPPLRALTIDAEGYAQYLYPEYVGQRTQDCPIWYHDIGLFYFFKTDIFLHEALPSVTALKKKAVVVPRSMAVDIDTEDDWAYAEYVMHRHHAKQSV